MGRRSRKRIAAAGRAPTGKGTAAGAPAAAEARAASPPRRSAAAASGGAPGPGHRPPGKPRSAPAPTPGRRSTRPAAPPPAAWSPFPLVELAILIGLVLVVAGFLTHGPRGGVLLGCGLGLASLATLEQTIREHFTGFRSHASLLSGAGAVAVAAGLYAFTRLPQPAPLAISAGVFVTLWRLLGVAHRRAQAPPPPR